MRLLTVLFMVPLWYIGVGTLNAQALSFLHLNKQRGFGQSVCYDVFKDSEGFIWITTISGLYRFDGNQFVDHTQGSDALKGHALVSVIEDQRGALWLSRFGDELVRYDRKNGSYQRISLSSLSDQVPADLSMVRLLYVDIHNHIWMQLTESVIACYHPASNSLQCYGGHEFTSVRLFPKVSQGTAPYFAALRKESNKIVVGRTDPSMQVQWLDSISNWPKNDLALAMCDSLNVWGASESTLLRYSLGDKSTTTYTLEGIQDVVYDPGTCYVDDNCCLWFSAADGLLQISTAPQPSAYYHQHQASADRSIAGKAVPRLRDRDGVMWCTVYGKGISYADVSGVRFHNALQARTTEAYGASNYVRALASNAAGEVFAAVQSGGVLALDSLYAVRAWTLSAGRVVVEHMLTEPAKGVWMAGDALYLHEEGSLKPKRFAPEATRFGGFTVLHRSSDGELLAGGYQCIYLFNEATGRFHLPKGLPQKGTYCVLYNIDQMHLLACRRDEGISLYRKGDDGYDLVKEVDANVYVKCITRDRDGRLLVATTVGLYAYNLTTHDLRPLEAVNKRLPDKYMYSVLQDKKGRYWASTNEGLCTWMEDGDSFYSFDLIHGLQDMEFNTNAYCAMPNGDLLFGGVNGINIVEADQLLHGQGSAPPLRLLSMASRDVDLADASIAPTQKAIFMGQGNNAVEMAYAALAYLRAGRVQVRYRLAGHDDAWQVGPSHGRVRFANVTPNTYTYEMQVADADGNWSNEVLTWKLLIKPLWWQMWWVRVLAALTALGIAAFAVKAYTARRLQQQRETLLREAAVQQERERITADLHDDIGATLSSMYLYGDLASTVWKDKPEESRKMLGTITSHSKELMQRMSDIVWSLKPADELSAGLSVRLRNHARELVEGTGLNVKITMDEELDRNIRNPVVRKNLLLIAKEAMNNAVKYSEAQLLQVKMYREGGEVHLRISDDGKGFEINTTEQGNGLSNMRQRCERLGGGINIDTAPGRGCTVHCILPIAIFRQGLVS